MKENGKYKYDTQANETKEGDEEGEGKEVPLAEGMGEAAKAATETVKSAAAQASEAVKQAGVGDSDAEEHDEL